MPRVTKTRPGPNCQTPTQLTWDQTMGWQKDYPASERVADFDCPTGCQTPFSDLQAVYPTARSGPTPSPTT